MNKNGKGLILLLILSFQISFIFNSVEITLSSNMTNIEESTYQISNNIIILTSDEEYIIKGSCSECGIEVKKETSQTIVI